MNNTDNYTKLLHHYFGDRIAHLKFVYYIHALGHFSENRIPAVEVWCWRMCDKKLAAFGIVAG